MLTSNIQCALNQYSVKGVFRYLEVRPLKLKDRIGESCLKVDKRRCS